MANAGVESRVGRSSLGQAHWGLASQGLNTGTNFVLSILVARSATPADFGQFSLVVIVYILAVGTLRTTGNNVLTIGHSTSAETLHRRGRDNVAFAAGLGALVGAGCLLVALAATGPVRPVLFVMGFALPFLLVQDALRGLAFAQTRPAMAATIDGIWVVTQTAGAGALLWWVAEPAMWAFAGCWAAGGAVAALVGLFLARIRPVVHLPYHWLRENRALAGPLFGSYLLTALPLYVTFLALPFVTDLAEIGVLRAAYLFFGPLGTLNAAAYSLTLVDAVRVPSASRRTTLVRRVSLGLTAISIAWGFLIVLLPGDVGRWLIGTNWNGSLEPRLLLAVTLAAEAALVGALAGLAAMRMAPRATRVQMVTAPLTLVLSVALAAPFGAAGAAGGLALGNWICVGIVWARYPAATRAAAVARPEPERRRARHRAR